MNRLYIESEQCDEVSDHRWHVRQSVHPLRSQTIMRIGFRFLCLGGMLIATGTAGTAPHVSENASFDKTKRRAEIAPLKSQIPAQDEAKAILLPQTVPQISIE